MTVSRPALLVSALITLLLAYPTFADEESGQITSEQILAHPEVKGALAAIDAFIEGVQIYDKIPGISAGIVSDQDLIWSKGYGYANPAANRQADADTLYSICSISKLFTSIGIMQLRDAGKLRLGDSVNQHLDWFNIEQAHAGSGPITIESLLTHSSGLPRESDFPYWNGPDFPFPTREQLIDRLATQETLYPAQHYFQYSNLALSLAGEIIQERSGQDYGDYIKGQILEPLGLSSTRTYYPVEMRGDQLAIGYTGMHRSGMREPADPFFTRGITAAAGFTSSVNDLASFASWQFRLLENGGKEVLDANTLREMHRVHWVDPDWETTWGIGFGIRRVEDTTLIGHGGGCPGYITNFLMVPKYKIAAIVLTNAGDGPAGMIAQNILKTIGTAMKEASSPSEEAMPDLSMYEGNYETRPWGGEVAVRQWGNQLVVIDLPTEDLAEAMIKLEHDSNHTFIRLTEDDERREPWTFELDDDGNTARIFRHSIYLNRIE
jgi:CubicO group peptidase (beta-lactamase class C family)